MENKSIILSGPQASGKSRIAHAMRMTHDRPLVTTAHDVLEKHESEEIPENLSLHYSLIIIEECTLYEIIAIRKILEIRIELEDVWDPMPVFDRHLPLVFTTQEKVTQQDVDSSKFIVVECTYPGLPKS